MIKKDLVKQVATKVNAPQTKVEKIFDALIEAIQEGLKKDKIVKIKGLGVFKVVEKKGYKVKNLKTGKELKIGPKNVVIFRSSSKVKKIINKEK